MCFQFDIIQLNKKPGFFILRHKHCTMNFCTIQQRCRNLLLCFRLDARKSNILIFRSHFFHQANKSFYLHSLIFNVVSVLQVSIRSQENRYARGKVDNILLPHMQKSREALADALKSIRKRIENK